MASEELLPFGIGSFLAALFPLEFGADKFIDHTAILARRIGVSETIVALLTAGGEWEEVCNGAYGWLMPVFTVWAELLD
jgi:hypothetical protein